MNEPIISSNDRVMLDDEDGSELEVEETPKIVFKTNYEAKLKELLHKINSLEIKLCSDATKEFIKLLKGNSGGELLRLYVHTSNRFSELLEAWKLRQGKPGLSYILSLVSAILSHPEGMYKPNDKEVVVVSRVIDKFARMILEEKMSDIYKELNSKEGKRQIAALLLMASIVRRGSGLASDVAKSFDFKLQVFSKLAEYKQRWSDKKRKHLTRKSFVRFAMSFLEVGKPGLLRWVLQQKEMYSGVLRGLGNDEEETIIFVLSTLRNRVLTEESLVPPGLRSVLFGSVTLEQLVNISGRENGGPAAELAHQVLVMVCTDPCNGLMPDLKRHPNPLRGNPTRLLGLMKKLKATEINYHRDLLLMILQGRPSLGSAYLNEFPYNLEDYTSPTWFANVSLAANLVSSVGTGLSFNFFDVHSHDLPSYDNADVRTILNCICPHSFSRSVVNKGLLHSDFLVKHGTLRLLLEGLKLLDSFTSALHSYSCSSIQMMQSWASLNREIQNEVRNSLPDPQVLLSLFSLQSSQSRNRESHSKRKAESANLLKHSGKGTKKLKMDVNEDSDIIVSGINTSPQVAQLKDSEKVVDTLIVDQENSEKDFGNLISEIWGPDLCSEPLDSPKDAEIYFHSKLLDALKIYLRTVPTILEGSFDFFVNLLNDPLALPTNLQSSLLSLLMEYIGWSARSRMPIKMPPQMYKHLQSFINLLIFSPIGEIRDQAYNLAQAAMSSTGAFDRNLHEIGAWLSFLPGYSTNKLCVEEQGVEVLQSLCRVVISFFSDAISTVGNNLFKYWAMVEQHINQLRGSKDLSPEFSPLIICVLQKCLRLLSSESGTFLLPEKSIISLYVCNTLKYLLQTQVDVVPLSALIESILSEGLEVHCAVDDASGDILCEWRPLKNLLLFSQSLSNGETHYLFSIDKKTMPGDCSFANTVSEVKELISDGQIHFGIVYAFSSAMLCATPGGILKNFPPVMTISQRLLRVPVSLLFSVFFLEQSLLTSVSKLWPEMFFSGLEMAVSMMQHEVREVDDASGLHAHSFFSEEMLTNIDFDATRSAAGAFGLFLKQAPFHVLFPAILSVEIPNLLEPSTIKDLLLAKLSACTNDSLISPLRLVLFWFYQIQSSYRIKPEAKLQQLSKICLILVKHLVAQLFVLKSDSSCPANAGSPLLGEITQEVVKIIFSHPVVLDSLSCPLSCNEELTEGNLGQILEASLSSSQERVHKMDSHVLDILKTTSEYLLSSKHSIKPLMKAFNVLVQRLLTEIRNKFDLCIGTEDVLPLLPGFYASQALIRFMSPFELLELIHWMFSRLNVEELSACKSGNVSPLSVGSCIAGGAFETLSTYLQQPIMTRVSYDLLWNIEEKTFDDNLIEEIYIELCKLATNFDLDFVDSCLLKAVHAVYSQNHMRYHSLHPLSYIMSRVVARTPIEMISHCIYNTNMTKAKFVFLLTKMSPIHLSVFGNLLLRTMNKELLSKGNVMGTYSCALSDEDFMMLLPAAVSFLNLSFAKFKNQYYKYFKSIPSFYSRILLNGFCHWNSFVSGYMFQEEYDEFIPSSTEELLNLVDGSLLGKAVYMLRCHFALSGDSLKTKKLVKLFNCICPCSGTHKELLDCDVNEIKSNSVNQSLNLINRVVAKISLCRMLLFPEDNPVQCLPKEADGSSKELSLDSGSGEQYSLRLRFMNSLVDTWQWLVKNSIYDGSKDRMNNDSLRIYNLLEVFLLRNVLELTKRMLDRLIQLQSIPFLEQLIRSCLLYRFEDPTTLTILQSILTLLSEGKFSCALCLQLLLAHSQFAPAIQSISRISHGGAGVLLRPMSSILRSLVIPHPDPNIIARESHLKTTEPYTKQLQIIKLLRTFLQFNSHLCDSEVGGDSGINLRELYSLLLPSYGATLSDIDLEIYSLMCEIELIAKSDNEIAQFDYLWGGAALKIRKDQAVEREVSSNNMTDAEALEQRRSQFRENLPVEPKICAMTVLYFPYNRSPEDGPLSSYKLEPDKVKNKYEAVPPALENVQRYDPVFILRFSIYSLSVGYIEPVEFAGLGLLAVAFTSMASPDVGMRKLGYETLGRFKDALENCQKKKDVMRLRLLLTYMQNGIEEPWQRIPSVIAIFAAETSLLLLDPSHDHYITITKFFMRSSRANAKCIPLFHDFFSSSSVNFKTERLWILRLAYAGLNLDDDAQIYIRNSILETLLSFYSSPLSDNESKELILLIVKKSVKFQKMACYLVEHCGLFSWLSSLLPFSTMMLLGDGKRFSLTQLVMVIEVICDVISSRNITEWLQKHALEQLMEFSCRLYKLLVGGVNLIRENVSLVNSMLEILISTLKISQKRKMYQPHFTLSLESLLQIYEAVNVYNTAKSSANAQLGLQAILMSTPVLDIFHTNQEKLSSFLTWAVSTALNSDYGQLNQLRESHIHFTMISEDALVEESLTSKLLRWLVASVILGKLSVKPGDSDSISKRSYTNLLSLLENVEKGCEGKNKSRFDCEKILAATILYLQQNLGMHCRVLPSVTSALSLLILFDVSECAGSSFMLSHKTYLSSLWSKIRCPAEANPSWRWSYYQPWKDLSSEPSDVEKIDELHACQMLLVVIPNVVGNKYLDSQVLSCQDIEISSVFEWERSIIEAEYTKAKISS